MDTDTQAAELPAAAPLWRHLLAMVYDTFLVLPIIMAGVALVLGLQAFLVPATADPGGGPIAGPWAVRLIALVVTIGFFVAFWSRGGQTLGMQAWRIRLVGLDGEVPSKPRLVGRCLAALLSALPFGAGYLWALVDPMGRSWHDRLSATRLQLQPPARRRKKHS